MMRDLIYALLTQDETVNGYVNDRVYPAGSLGVLPVLPRPDRPFILIGQLPDVIYLEVRKTARPVSQTYEIRGYDDRGDYLRLDRLLRASREALLQAEGMTSPEGAFCSAVFWEGMGPDSTDPDLDLNLKVCTMRFVTNI